MHKKANIVKFKKIIDKFKTKWGINSTLDIVLILVVFSLAGMFVLKINKIVMDFIGITPDEPFFIRAITHIILILPIYQLLLLFFGFCLGQFQFFWNKEKRLIKWIRKRLTL